MPRYSLWCGTTRTEDWHTRFRARAVISGHLHFRTTLWRHGVRFDEVDGDILFVYARDEDIAAEIEDTFALHISIVATAILKRKVAIVLVLPKQLTH